MNRQNLRDNLITKKSNNDFPFFRYIFKNLINVCLLLFLLILIFFWSKLLIEQIKFLHRAEKIDAVVIDASSQPTFSFTYDNKLIKQQSSALNAPIIYKMNETVQIFYSPSIKPYFLENNWYSKWQTLTISGIAIWFLFTVWIIFNVYSFNKKNKDLLKKQKLMEEFKKFSSKYILHKELKIVGYDLKIDYGVNIESPKLSEINWFLDQLKDNKITFCFLSQDCNSIYCKKIGNCYLVLCMVSNEEYFVYSNYQICMDITDDSKLFTSKINFNSLKKLYEEFVMAKRPPNNTCVNWKKGNFVDYYMYFLLRTKVA